MNKLTYTIILLLGFSLTVFSQKAPVVQWQKCIGGSGSDVYVNAKMLPTSKGTFVILSSSNSNDGDFNNLNKGQYDLVLVEVDINGNIIRKKSIGGSGEEQAIDFDILDDDGLVIVAQSYSFDGDLQGLPQGYKNTIFTLNSNWDVNSRAVLGIRNVGAVASVKKIPLSNNFVITGFDDLWSPLIYVTDQSGIRNYAYSFSTTPFVPNATRLFDLSVGSTYNSAFISSTAGYGPNSLKCSQLPTNHYWVTNNHTLDSPSIKCLLFDNPVQQAVSINNAGISYVVTRSDQNVFPFCYLNVFKANSSGIIAQSNDLFQATTFDIRSVISSLSFDKSNIMSVGSSNDPNIASNSTPPINSNLGNSNSIFLSAIDSASLSLKWSNKYGGSMDDIGFSVYPTPDSGYLVLGKTFSNDGDVSGNHGSDDIWILKLKASVECKTIDPLLDTIQICGSNTILDAGVGFSTYFWNTTENSQSIRVSNSGKYSVSLSDSNGCTYSDQTYVSVIDAKIIQNDTTVCQNEGVRLDANLRNPVKQSYIIGERGPAGGIVFYDKGNSDNGWRYLEAAPNDLISSINWACTTIPTLDGSLFGDGFENTIDIMKKNAACLNSGPFAASICDTFSYGGYNDWYLPSRGELLQMGALSQLIGGFPPKNSTVYNYWSSTQFSLSTPRQAWAVNINGEPIVLEVSRNLPVRAIRRFDIGNEISLKWSTGATTESINVFPNENTKYFLTASNGLFSCTDSISVTVAAPDTSITVLDGASVCSASGNVRLQAGNSPTYKWLKDNIVIEGASSKVISVSEAGSYRVVTSTIGGCFDTSRAVSITNSPIPQVAFHIDSASQCINGNSFRFDNISSIAAGSISGKWYINEIYSSDAQIFNKSFDSSGNFRIKLVVTSNNGCSDSLTKEIKVLPEPSKPILTASKSDFCIGDSITLTSSATAGLIWYRDNNELPGLNSKTIRANQPGDYKVRVSNEFGCSSESIANRISENPLPIGVLSQPVNPVICEGTPTQLIASGAFSYKWFLNNNLIPDVTGSSYNALQSGTYTVDFISDKGCIRKSSSTIVLTLLQRPKASFDFDSYCALLPINFTSTSIVTNSGSVQYFWNLGNGISGTGKNFSHTFSSATNISAKLFVKPDACPSLTDSLSKSISVEIGPAGINYPIVNAVLNKPTTLKARTFGIGYSWQPAVDLSNPNIANPVLKATGERLYKILITSKAGCVTIDTQRVNIFKDRDIYVPKAFSPNNDGQNDRLYPIPVGIKEITQFKVFNRRGILVYDNKNANASTGWDGTFRGKQLPVDTCVWVAQGIDEDGKTIRRTGNVVLVR